MMSSGPASRMIRGRTHQLKKISWVDIKGAAPGFIGIWGEMESLMNPTAPILSCVVALAAASLPAAASANAKTDAQKLIDQSASVLNKAERDPGMAKLLKQAKGVFIIPRFGQGGVIVGGRGGEGVVLAHQNGRWSEPAFYDIGGVSVGAQAGGGGGSIIMVLVTDNALNDLKGSNNFSLNANAGLSIVNYSAKAQAGWGKADVVIWSNVKGAYAGATIGVSDIAQDQDQNHAYYGGQATLNKIFDGAVRNHSASRLVQALPTGSSPAHA